MIFVNDASGQTVYAGPEWPRLTGQPLDQSLGRDWLARIHRDDRGMVEDTHSRATEAASEYGMVYRLLGPDDAARWVRIGARPSYGPPDGMLLGFFGSLVTMPESGRNRAHASIGRPTPAPLIGTSMGDDLDRIADHMLMALTLLEESDLTVGLPGLRRSLFEVGCALAARTRRGIRPN